MKTRSIIVWVGTYEAGELGVAFGRRAHWYINWIVPKALVWLIVAAACLAFLYGEFLQWRDAYIQFLSPPY